mgnify:CR=1 FL=1
MVQRHRDPDFHENLTMTDWGLACTLFMSHACIGQSSSARMYKAEATAIIIELVGHHRLGKYSNPIEMQLRKKAFWIMVAAHMWVYLLITHRLSALSRFEFIVSAPPSVMIAC